MHIIQVGLFVRQLPSHKDQWKEMLAGSPLNLDKACSRSPGINSYHFFSEAGELADLKEGLVFPKMRLVKGA